MKKSSDKKAFWREEFLKKIRRAKRIDLYDLCHDLEDKHDAVLDLRAMNKIFGLDEDSRRDVIEKVFPRIVKCHDKGYDRHNRKKIEVRYRISKDREFWRSEILEEVRSAKRIDLYDLCDDLGDEYDIELDLQEMNKIFGLDEDNRKDVIEKVFPGVIKCLVLDKKRIDLVYIGTTTVSPSPPSSPSPPLSLPPVVEPVVKLVVESVPETEPEPIVEAPPEEVHNRAYWEQEFLIYLREFSIFSLHELCEDMGIKHGLSFDLLTMNTLFELKEASILAVLLKVYPGLSIVSPGNGDPNHIELGYNDVASSSVESGEPIAVAPVQYDKDFWKAEILALVRKSKKITLFELCEDFDRRFQIYLQNLKTLNRIFDLNVTSWSAFVEKVFGGVIECRGHYTLDGKHLEFVYVNSAASSSRENFDRQFWRTEFIAELHKHKNIELHRLCDILGKKHNINLHVNTMNRIFELNMTSRKAIMEKVFPKVIEYSVVGEDVKLRYIGPSPESNSSEMTTCAQLANELAQQLAHLAGVHFMVTDVVKLLRSRHPLDRHLASVKTYPDAFRMATRLIKVHTKLRMVFYNEVAFLQLADATTSSDTSIATSFMFPLIEEGVTLKPFVDPRTAPPPPPVPPAAPPQPVLPRPVPSRSAPMFQTVRRTFSNSVVKTVKVEEEQDEVEVLPVARKKIKYGTKLEPVSNITSQNYCF